MSAHPPACAGCGELDRPLSMFAVWFMGEEFPDVTRVWYCTPCGDIAAAGAAEHITKAEKVG